MRSFFEPVTRQFQRRWKWFLTVGLGLILVSLGWIKWPRFLKKDSPTTKQEASPTLPDPRQSYRGPFQNVAPTVHYVGDAACAQCHPVLAASYQRHPMARTLLPIAEIVEAYPMDNGHHLPFSALGWQFEIHRQGRRVWHRQVRQDSRGQVLLSQESEVQYAIGSGIRGHSYLSSRDGYLFQTAISWYAQKQLWDLSPGFATYRITSRPVDGECLFCHSNHAYFQENTLNHYTPPIFDGLGIGCERCHGPGELHVLQGGRRDPKTRADYTIVNPKRLPYPLREAICQQCHLEGAVRVQRRGRHLYDFRPGLPLSDFWSVFVFAGDNEGEARAVSQVEQMYESRCFRASPAENKLGCTSCHDPHVAVSKTERLVYYRQRCLRCHQLQSCTAPLAVRQAQQDSCIACHMPPYRGSDVPHTAATDHRIPRRPGQQTTAPRPGLAGSPLASFFSPQEVNRREELERDLGIGLVNLMVRGQVNPQLFTMRAASLLEAALHRDPTDVAAWQARAHTLILVRNLRSALATYETALRLAPEHEACLVGAATVAQKLGAWRKARGYWQRAIAVNPWMAAYHAGLATVLAEEQDWSAALTEARAWLRLEADSLPARQLLIYCLLQTGQEQEAHVEFRLLETLAPQDERSALQRWFAETRRSQGKSPLEIPGKAFLDRH